MPVDSLPLGSWRQSTPHWRCTRWHRVDVHANVAAAPTVTDAGLADKLTVGTGGGVTETVVLASMVPPGPVQDKV